MKLTYKFSYVILGLFFYTSAFAQKNSAPESIIRAMIAGTPIAGKECKDAPEERCFSFDGIDIRDHELVDNMVLDFIRKEQESQCLDELNCQEQLEALVCSLGSPVKNLESLSVYCAVEAYKKDGVKLVESAAKKAARLASEKAAEDSKKALELKCKSFSFKGTTIAALRQELNESLECGR